MAKSSKKSLKAALSSQQSRLKKNQKVAQAAQVREKAPTGNAKDKGKAPPRRPVVPFTSVDNILLIGEGNFSFAAALFKHPALQYLPAANVTATAYDSEEECLKKYPEAGEILVDLRAKGVEVLFNVDATMLETCKPLKGRHWDRIVWNFPHAGKGITDQDRNILSNQVLLLGFLRSAEPFLKLGPAPSFMKKRAKSGPDSDGEPMDSGDEDLATQRQNSGSRGTILVTLRNVAPYTEWDLPRLAKKPPPASGPSGKPNPLYTQLRSFVFRRSDWPGYEHRMTKGERAHGCGTTGRGGEDRTWEFCLFP